MTNPLSTWLRAASADERATLAAAAETSVSYLYQLAGARDHRRRPNVVLAVRLEAASRAAHLLNGALPVFTVVDLAGLFK